MTFSLLVSHIKNLSTSLCLQTPLLLQGYLVLSHSSVHGWWLILLAELTLLKVMSAGAEIESFLFCLQCTDPGLRRDGRHLVGVTLKREITNRKDQTRGV